MTLGEFNKYNDEFNKKTRSITAQIQELERTLKTMKTPSLHKLFFVPFCNKIADTFVERGLMQNPTICFYETDYIPLSQTLIKDANHAFKIKMSFSQDENYDFSGAMLMGINKKQETSSMDYGEESLELDLEFNDMQKIIEFLTR